MEKEIGERREISFHGVGVSVGPASDYHKIYSALDDPDEVTSLHILAIFTFWPYYIKLWISGSPKVLFLSLGFFAGKVHVLGVAVFIYLPAVRCPQICNIWQTRSEGIKLFCLSYATMAVVHF